MNKITPGFLRYASQLRGPTKTGMIAKALTDAADKIEQAQRDSAGLVEMLGKRATELSEENERLLAAVEFYESAICLRAPGRPEYVDADYLIMESLPDNAPSRFGG